MGKIGKVAYYVRKSIHLVKGDTLELQVDICNKAAASDLGVCEDQIDYFVYKDEKSGKNTDRDGLQRLLKDIRKKRINRVYVYKLDRLGRSASDLLDLVKEFEKYGVVLVSVKDSIRTDTASAKLIITVLAIVAEIERENTVQRVIEANKRLSEKGFWLGSTAPLGFKSEYVENKGIVDASAKKLVVLKINEEEKKIVECIFDAYTTGEMKTLAMLSRMLEDMGILTKTGKKIFSTKTLESILRNPVYVQATQAVIEYLIEKGYLEENILGKDKINGIFSLRRINTCTCSDKKKLEILKDKPEWIEGWEENDEDEMTLDDLPRSLKLAKSEQKLVVGPQEGFIDAKKWLIAQKRLDFRKGEKSRICVTHDNVLLTGKIFRCKKCGNTMVHYNAHCKRDHSIVYPSYRCSGKRGHKSDCTVSNINATELDSKIIDEIFKLKDEYITNHDYLASIFENVERYSRDREIELMRSNKRKLEKEKEYIVHTLISLDGKGEDDLISDIRKQYKDINEKIEETNRNIEKMEKEKQEIKRGIDDIGVVSDELVNMDREVFDKLSIGEKRAIIMDVIEFVEWDGTNIEIHFKRKDELIPTGVSETDTPDFNLQHFNGVTRMNLGKLRCSMS